MECRGLAPTHLIFVGDTEMKLSEILEDNGNGKALQFIDCFRTCWNNEYPSKRTEIDGYSRDNAVWTKFMLGEKETDGVYGDAFLKRVCQEFIQCIDYKPDLEWHLDGWYTVDACIVEKDKTPNCRHSRCTALLGAA